LTLIIVPFVFLFVVFTDLINVRTRNSAKQSRSEQVFALNLSFDTIIFCEKY